MHLATCATALVVVASVGPARAESVWTGNAVPSGVAALWTAPANWSPNGVPPSGDNVRFGTGFNSGSTINPDGNHTVGILIIDTTTPFFIENFGGSYTINLTDILPPAIPTATRRSPQTCSSPLTVSSKSAAAPRLPSAR